MEVNFKLEKTTLTIYLSGEFDECSSSLMRKKVDEIIDKSAQADTAVFNLADVNFMDSTGIGFLIGRYKKLRRYGMSMAIEEPNFSADKILSMSGVYSLIQKV